MVSALRAEMPSVAIRVVSSCPAGYLASHSCEEVRYDDLDALEESIRDADLVLLGGGSIFFDYWGCDTSAILTPRHEGLSLWMSIARLAERHDTPLMLYGVGIGPLTSPEGRAATAEILHIASVVTVRDAGSAELARELQSGVAVTSTGDPALRVPTPLLALPTPHDGPVVGVCVRPWEFDVDAGQWQSAMGAGLEAFLTRSHGSAHFVACHRKVVWPLSDDAGAGTEIAGHLTRPDRVQVVTADLQWRDRVAALLEADLVLAMRYHAALFALSAGVPVVALSYDPKVRGLMADWGMSEFCVDLADVTADGITDLLMRASAEREELSQRATRNADKARVAEADNARLAGALVAGRLATPLDSEPRVVRPTVAILTNRLVHRQTGAPYVGGAERYAQELAELLRDLGLDVTFFQREGDWGTSTYFGFPVVALPRGDHYSEFETGITDAFTERTRDFDHVLCLMPNYAARPLRDDAVVVLHGVWWDHDLWDHVRFRTPEWYDHLAQVVSNGARTVSVDQNGIDVVRALFPDAANRMRLIPNATDLTRFHPGPPRQVEVPHILFPRRADVIRGPRLVGPILERLADPCRVTWLGDGDPALLDELRSVAAADARLSVTTAEFDEMPAHYRDADICVIPTLGSEGQSLACLEAMASGCAVVATRVGGLPELIDDGVDGLLCDPTPDSLADAIRRLVRDPGLRQRLGRAARQSAKRHSLRQWRHDWAREFVELGWVDSDSAADPYDVICLAIVDWDFRWQRPQQLMSAWAARGRRVFYVRPSDHLPPDGPKLSVQSVGEGVWEVRLAFDGPFNPHTGDLPEGFTDRVLAGLAELREQFAISDAVAVVQIAGWSSGASAACDQWSWPLVYDCMDDWSTFPGFVNDSPFLALEQELVDRADVIVASSRTIQQRWEANRPDVVLARNGADFDFFNRPHAGPLPSDIEGPVAGFYGSIVEWFDRDLLEHVARARPDVTFVLVGPVQRVDVHALEALPNVRFEGLQPYETMPRYLQRFDVCLVPFEVSPVTDGMDVVKFYEYISQGKPVVSTRIREIVPYGDLLYLADDAEHFVELLDVALAEDDSELVRRRVLLARQNTWADRVDLLEHAMRHRSIPMADSRSGAGSLSASSDEIAQLREEADSLRDQLAAVDRSRAVTLARLYWKAKSQVRSRAAIRRRVEP